MVRGEKGQALIYVTLVLVLTMIVIPPLLTFIGGAGRSAQIREDRMLQVYAADAGIEDGFFKITKGNLTELPWSGNISDLNGHDVSILIEQEAGGVYKITSTATDYTGRELTVESYAASLDFSYLFNNAISSYGDMTLKSGVEVYGNTTLNDELDNKGDVYGETIQGAPGWPQDEEMKEHYADDVQGVLPYGSSGIEIDQDLDMERLYRSGDLDIYCSNATSTLTILDTFYVTGDLDIGLTDKDFYLDLNGQTVFCEQAIDIGGKCTVMGSGVIVALGDAYFSPKVQSGPDDFIFVMSVSGDLQVQPNGDFHGGMAGSVEVQYQPNSTITWREVAFDPNFPSGEIRPGVRGYIIRG